MITTYQRVLNADEKRVNLAFIALMDGQTKSDDREELMETAYRDLHLEGLQDSTYEEWTQVIFPIKVHILHHYLTRKHNLQGEPITKESKELIKDYLFGIGY